MQGRMRHEKAFPVGSKVIYYWEDWEVRGQGYDDIVDNELV